MGAQVANHAPAVQGRLEAMLRRNRAVCEILTRAPGLQLPDRHLGAGCITPTVWNELHGFTPDKDIKDYDLVCFASSTRRRSHGARCRERSESPHLVLRTTRGRHRTLHEC